MLLKSCWLDYFASSAGTRVAADVVVSAGFTRRIEEFRSLNEKDNTVLNFFDEMEIHPEIISTPALSLALHTDIYCMAVHVYNCTVNPRHQ